MLLNHYELVVLFIISTSLITFEKYNSLEIEQIEEESHHLFNPPSSVPLGFLQKLEFLCVPGFF